MIDVKKQVGEEKATSAARAMIGCLFYSIPILVINFYSKNQGLENNQGELYNQ